jgi:Fe-S oxidoreductase
MDTEYLEELQSEMNTCIRCAYCFEQCPVIKVTKWDTDGARGKVILSYGLLSGELEPSQYIADKLFSCTLCRDCLERCPSKVQILDIIQMARADLVEAGFATDTHNHIMANIKKTGNIDGVDEVVGLERDGDIPLFVGCQYSRSNKTRKMIKILEAVGIKPKVQEELCCGFPMDVLGFQKNLEEHKKEFQELFKADEAIAMCPSCTIFLNEGHGIKTRHILQVLADILPEADLGMKVTYHDPCDLSRHLEIIDEPRQILKKLGVELVEMAHSKKNSMCCGGGGGILMSNAPLSDSIAVNRIHEALDTGADMLVTSCPTCEMVLRTAAKAVEEEEGRSIKVSTIDTLIWKSMKAKAK